MCLAHWKISTYLAVFDRAVGTILERIHTSYWFRGAYWLLPNSYNIFLPENVFCIQVMPFDYSAKCHRKT